MCHERPSAGCLYQLRCNTHETALQQTSLPANYDTRRCSRTMLIETPCLGVGLIPVLEFGRLHVLEVDLVVAEASADSAGDGSD